MLCKFCNAEIGEGRRFCPECGKPLTAEAEAAAIVEKETPKASKKSKAETWKLVALIAGLVLVVGILALVLLQAFDVSLFPKEESQPEDIQNKTSYAVDTQEAVQAEDTVIATIGSYKIDNALLQVFCLEEFESFVSEYYDYISYIGLDLSTNLSEQTCYFDEALTWEQFFIEAALESWQSYALMGTLAEQHEFVMDAEWKDTLDSMAETLEEDAKNNGYESADAMLRARYGESCSVAVYSEYVNMVFYANAFYTSQFEFSDSDIAEAFDANEATLAEKGVTKTSALKADVRHLLVMPEGGTTGEDGNKTYSEDEWAACLAEAEKLLQEWKDGEATEESFAELVEKHTDDTASASTGGLYEGVLNDGTYMEEFQNWAVDINRQTGDTGIVRTTAGCHIMYFVAGEPEWLYYAEALLQDARFEELQKQMETIQTENTLNVSYSKIAIEQIYK